MGPPSTIAEPYANPITKWIACEGTSLRRPGRTTRWSTNDTRESADSDWGAALRQPADTDSAVRVLGPAYDRGA